MQIEHGAIFRFDDAVDYINYEFELKRLRNSRFSLRSWARQLGYKNPSFLSHLLKKRRALKIEVANKFTSNLKLSGNEKKYFEVLVLLKESKTVEQKNIYVDILDSLKPAKNATVQSLSLEAFRVVSEWYHTAILELVELSDFKNDAEWIQERLGNEVSTQNISKAIDRLLKLELLKLTKSGSVSRAKSNPLLLENYIPSEAIRYFHKQIIGKAMTAIDDQAINERDVRSSMISIRMNDYKKAQEIIKRAHGELVKLSCKGNGQELYQLSTQFFRITKKKEDL